jgi:ribose-phosphate pyrophosphokinase
MIILLDTSEMNGNFHVVIPTIFPDKTSQVWKIPNIETMTSCYIEWKFEQEVELIWLNQLLALLKKYEVTVTELYIPYLPYARQDKAVSNDATFSREVFLNMLDRELPFKITSLDIHSPSDKIINITPEKHILHALCAFKPSVIVYPDEGARLRYSKLRCLENCAAMIISKTRDQKTGEITGLTTKTNLKKDNDPFRFLMIDDICDGGATFIRIADYINQRTTNSTIGLYTTHGIYSKGKAVLYESGITQLFNAQTLGSI